MKDIQQQIENLEKELQQIEKYQSPTNDNQEYIKQLKTKKKTIEETIQDMKQFLHDINYKTIEESYQNYLNAEKKRKQVEEEIQKREEKKKKKEEWMLQKEKLESQQEILQKQIQNITTTLQKQQEELQKLKTLYPSEYKQHIQSLEQQFLLIKQHHQHLQTLITEYKEQQRELQKLKEQETIVSNLYNIVSKEILLLILEEHIPTINDIINVYLTQIGNYQIRLQIKK